MRCEALADELTHAGNLVMSYIANGFSGMYTAGSQSPAQIRAIFEELTHVTEFRIDLYHARGSRFYNEVAA